MEDVPGSHPIGAAQVDLVDLVRRAQTGDEAALACLVAVDTSPPAPLQSNWRGEGGQTTYAGEKGTASTRERCIVMVRGSAAS